MKNDEIYLSSLVSLIDKRIEQKFRELMKSPGLDQAEYYTLKEVAEKTGVSIKTVYSWLDKSLIPYTRPTGGKCYVSVIDLEEFINDPNSSFKSKKQLKKEADKSVSRKYK